MANNPVRIIQISDTHIFKNKEAALLGVPTEESFNAVVDLVKQNNEKMDFMLVTGDISQDGSNDAYERVAHRLKEFNVPAYWVAGNHDDPNALTKLYPLATMSNEKHIILGKWHIILLNSQVPGKVEGYLDPSQLMFMKKCLEMYPEHHAIIVFHHQPIPIGSKWLDNLGVKNADEFWKILVDFPKVNAVVFGHVHQESEQKHQNIPCYSLPSTCIQFKRHHDEFALDEQPPGYRWFALYEDGKIETGVKRLDKYVGKFEADSKGY